jgi:multimeric flavodoxin WrbA
MKVLGIVCSPRKMGNTEILMETALAGALSYGAEIESWTVVGKDLKPCDGCQGCANTGKCHIQDDMQDLYAKVVEADGIIFGSPTYFMSGTAQAKIVIDRMLCLYNRMNVFPGKIAGVVSVADYRGQQGVWYMFKNFFDLAHMISADYAEGFSNIPGSIRKDDYAMKAAEELGKEVVSLINMKCRWPEEYRRHIYRLCREEYGIPPYPLRYLSK